MTDVSTAAATNEQTESRQQAAAANGAQRSGRLPAETITAASDLMQAVAANVARAVHGKTDQIDLAVLCLAAEGHLLVEDVPGVGKTLLAKALARSVGGETSRVQFTPDLLPSDLTGVTILSQITGEFTFRPGPVFANVVLCDEINRASPKVQSSLLEAMEERQVSVDNQTHLLPRPFMVIATQNPIEQDGTYPLPESQLDRFLARLSLGYPDRESEIAVMRQATGRGHLDDIAPVADIETIRTLTQLVSALHVAPVLLGYVVDVLAASRTHPELRLGASPRAGQSWIRMSRARALMRGRDFVTPDDLRVTSGPVLSHRLLGRSRSVDIDAVLNSILASVPVPGSRKG